MFVAAAADLGALVVPEAGFQGATWPRATTRRGWWLAAISRTCLACSRRCGSSRSSAPTWCSAPAATSAAPSRSRRGCCGAAAVAGTEQHSGLANRWLARLADEVHLSFRRGAFVLHTQGQSQGQRQPVRAYILSTAAKPCANRPHRGPSDGVHLRWQPRRSPHQRSGARRDAAAERPCRRAVHPADGTRGLRLGEGHRRRRATAREGRAVPAAHPPGLRRRRSCRVPLRRDDAGRDRRVRHAGDPRALPACRARPPGGQREHRGSGRSGDDSRPRIERRTAREGDPQLSDRRVSPSANARLFARPDAAERIAKSLERWALGHPPAEIENDPSAEEGH